jgi:Asp-tRNA(Asn)/Glu-tRNA(Gln) amidotransferase A subunit family amidase
MPAPASPQSPRHSLTADAWAEAALDAIEAYDDAVNAFVLVENREDPRREIPFYVMD